MTAWHALFLTPSLYCYPLLCVCMRVGVLMGSVINRDRVILVRSHNSWTADMCAFYVCVN